MQLLVLRSGPFFPASDRYQRIGNKKACIHTDIQLKDRNKSVITISPLNHNLNVYKRVH